MDKFKSAKRNVELEIVNYNIQLLQEYKTENSPNKKQEIFSKIHPFVQSIIIKKIMSIDEYIQRLKKAIILDEYRPKNLMIFEFALGDDLDYTNGKFNTFDLGLSVLEKNEENCKKIRDKFCYATPNRHILAVQFTDDWVRRLIDNMELYVQVKYAKPDNIKKSYSELFQKLSDDFCDEYNIDKNLIQVKVIQNWSEVEKEKDKKDSTDGLTVFVNRVLYPDDPSKMYFAAGADVYVLLKKPEDINYTISVFAHEMHHALDHLEPEKGALGPQVKKIDDKTYVDSNKNFKEYKKSASELSSYEIEEILYNTLKNRH